MEANIYGFTVCSSVDVRSPRQYINRCIVCGVLCATISVLADCECLEVLRNVFHTSQMHTKYMT